MHARPPGGLLLLPRRRLDRLARLDLGHAQDIDEKIESEPAGETRQLGGGVGNEVDGVTVRLFAHARPPLDGTKLEWGTAPRAIHAAHGRAHNAVISL